MKLNYFLESDASKCCPPNVLKKGYRVRWQGDDTLMYGRIVGLSGSSVKVTDEKFGTDEKHVVNRDQIFQVLADPEAGLKNMKVMWAKNKYVAAKDAVKVKKDDDELEEALHHDRSIIKDRVTFKDDREVEEVVLTKLGPHDIAMLIAKVGVMNAYVDCEAGADKDKDYRTTAEPEDLEDMHPVSVDIACVAARAEEVADELAQQVKESLNNLSSGSFRDLVKHYFPDLN